MGAIIVKWWVEWALGIIAAGLGLACRKFYKLYKKEQARQKSDEESLLYEKIKKLIDENNESTKQADREIRQDMSDLKRSFSEEMSTIRSGILSFQGKSFKNLCKELLKPEHVITVEEFEQALTEHSTYKGLGGNHDGDTLFEMVVEKAKADAIHQGP